jgi:hypothetical protein
VSIEKSIEKIERGCFRGAKGIEKEEEKTEKKRNKFGKVVIGP